MRRPPDVEQAAMKVPRLFCCAVTNLFINKPTRNIGTNYYYMYRPFRVFLYTLVFSLPTGVTAQTDFFFNFYGGSTNFWSNIYMQLPTAFINTLIAGDDEEVNNMSLRYDFFHIKSDGSKLDMDDGNFWGFKAKDMFRNIQYGFKFGFQPQLSYFGVYISCAYQHRQFQARLDDIIDEWSKFRLNYISPGIGIRVTPLLGLLEDDGWSPIVEVGTSYNYNINCTGPYGHDKDQFNNGLTNTFAIGVRMEEFSVTGGVEIDNYNLFNQDYTPDNGNTYPFKDFKSHHLTIFLSISQDF